MCQVRFFLSDDCPSQTVISVHDHARLKTPLAPHPGGARTDGRPPPTFKNPPFPSIKSPVPSRSWKCPPMLVLCSDWLMVAGEESQEVENQYRRENRIPEAVYHSLSTIPPNPFTAIDAEIGRCDDQQTIQIPVVPLEEYEDRTMVDPPSDLSAHMSRPTGGLDLMHETMVLDPEELVVASAAAEIVKSSQQGRSIQHGLLLKILSNPKLVERLVAYCTRLPPTSPSSPDREMGPVGGTEVELVSTNQLDWPSPDGEQECYTKCVFFNSLTGCRYEEKCACKHGMFRPMLPTVQPMHSAKRVKADGEISVLW